MDQIIEVPQFSVKGHCEKIGGFDCKADVGPEVEEQIDFLTKRSGDMLSRQSSKL